MLAQTNSPSTIAVVLPDGFVVPYVEVAATEHARRLGLGWRQSVGLNEGMLFVFNFLGSHPIWMKGMLVPIDIVWIEPGNFVRGLITLEPGDMTARDVACKTICVLELAAGQCEAHGVTIGSWIRMTQTP